MNPKKSTSKQPYGGTAPRVIRDFSGGAPRARKETRKRSQTSGALLGVVSVSVFQAVLLWLAVTVLHSAGAVSWQLSAWHSLALSCLYLLWRTLYSYVFARMDSANQQEG